MIEVEISPCRIRAGIAEDLHIHLTNTGPGTCTNIIFSIRMPPGLVRLRGKDRIERSALAAGESFSASMRVIAKTEGHFQLKSPNFSYRNHRGQACHADFVTKITVEPGRGQTSPPRLSAELLTEELPLSEWSVLGGRVTNVGESEASDVKVTLTGQAVTADPDIRFLPARLAPGDAENLEFLVLAREPGTHVPVHLSLSCRGPDGRRYDKKATRTIRVGHDQEAAGEAMKVLFLAATPPNLPRLRVDEEIREIEQEIRLGRERDLIQVETRWAVRSRDIGRALFDVRPDLVHFAGHGGGGEESFAAEDETGKAIVLPVDSLVDIFKAAGERVRCILVNACSTERLAVTLSAALPLAYVIGMRQPVADRSSISFSIGFYQALAAGGTVKQAFRLGRAQIVQGRDTPLLLLNGQVITPP